MRWNFAELLLNVRFAYHLLSFRWQMVFFRSYFIQIHFNFNFHSAFDSSEHHINVYIIKHIVRCQYSFRPGIRYEYAHAHESEQKNVWYYRATTVFTPAWKPLHERSNFCGDSVWNSILSVRNNSDCWLYYLLT